MSMCGLGVAGSTGAEGMLQHAWSLFQQVRHAAQLSRHKALHAQQGAARGASRLLPRPPAHPSRP